MDDALEQRTREMFLEDTTGLSIADLVTWESLGNDGMGERIRKEYRAAARREADMKREAS